jgi:hypothetical protein
MTMTYQGTFLSDSVTLSRTFGAPDKDNHNLPQAKWETDTPFGKVRISTTDGRSFVAYGESMEAYNKVVNKIQINTL